VTTAASRGGGRVIAGTARGIRLEAPGPGTRPLGDRVKQALFAILEPDLGEANTLDLFAGSGAAGIEALSRGATRATFVERDATAIQVIATNLARTGLADQDRALLVRADAVGWLADRARDREPAYDLVVIDPPYDDRAALLRSLELVGRLVAIGGSVVAKHFWRDTPPTQVGLLASDRDRRFGETSLTFYRRTEAAASREDG
jgi:16S rRNA (guanine966-N2)-methyltransferase